MTMSQGPSPSQSQAQLALGGHGEEAALALHPGEAVLPGIWDEMREPTGQLRAPWQAFASWLRAAGGADGGAARDPRNELERRARQVAEQIRLDGVTHNVFQDGAAASRPWSLSLLPLIVGADEWRVLESGVMQHAALMEAVLSDVYGPQRLLHEGLLPPSLVFRHSGFLHQMVGVRPAWGNRLHIVAFDVARGGDGRWWVVSRRTQGPSGLGYVLHNRLVIARQFPDAFRELRVQHIASSYRRLLDTLDAGVREVAARLGDGSPRVVLLTPGPFSETYFEHAYLARYLGLPLAEGGDLLVRGRRLFLKTVEGLEPVHGLLRRLDDAWCDPLELRADSTLGVPGLLQAVRAGNVVMANALGSGFLESPAMHGFLPGLADRLLGEKLQLPTLPTWWCGEAAAWAGVQHELDGKVLRATYPRHASERAAEARTVTHRNDDLRALRAMVDADPDAWTLQSRLQFSRAPIWQHGKATARQAMIRVYAIAGPQGHWHVLPGGMTRVATTEDGSVSMQRGGTSLDTWVLTDGAVDNFSMLPQRLQVDDLVQRSRPVSSRTGENLFWLGRYTERTEQLVRLARATLLLIDADTDADPAVQRAMSTLAVKTGLGPWGVPTLLQSPHVFERALLLGLGDVLGSSVAYNLASLQRCSQALRERLSGEQWGLIRRMDETFAESLREAADDDVALFGQAALATTTSARGTAAPAPVDVAPQITHVMVALDRLAVQLAAVTGAQTDRMTRDHGWRLLTVGRLLERLHGLTTRFEAFLAYDALASAAGIDLLLDLFDSTITYRARYQRREDLLALTDMLVLDSSNPRAYAGVLRRLRTELSKLPGDEELRRGFIALLPAVGAGLTLESLRGVSDAALAARLLALSQQLSQAAVNLSDGISQAFFTLADQRARAV